MYVFPWSIFIIHKNISKQTQEYFWSNQFWTPNNFKPSNQASAGSSPAHCKYLVGYNPIPSGEGNGKSPLWKISPEKITMERIHSIVIAEARNRVWYLKKKKNFIPRRRPPGPQPGTPVTVRCSIYNTCTICLHSSSFVYNKMFNLWPKPMNISIL